MPSVQLLPSSVRSGRAQEDRPARGRSYQPWDAGFCPSCSSRSPRIADSAGAHGLARDALLAALPFASVAALVVFGDYVDSPRALRRAAGALLGAIVALLVLSCALRSSAVHGVPPLAVSSLLAVVALFALKAALAAGRRTGAGSAPLSPAKP